jgi:hypothetical protein
MAVLAWHGGVHADEWEVAHVVIEYHPLAPASFAVTLLALVALLAAVHIIEAVAHAAFGLVLFLAGVTLMTADTGYVAMLALEGILGIPGMVEPGLAPAHYLVAVVALVAVTALVFVVMFVTVDAGSAGKFFVAETVLFPSSGTMAVLAAFSQYTFVDVLGLVAWIAGGFEFFLEISLVAAVAACLLVTAVEGKVGLYVMVELGTLPALGGVALLAFAAVLAGVDIVEAVAGETFLWCILVTPLEMTEVAADFSVLAG